MTERRLRVVQGGDGDDDARARSVHPSTYDADDPYAASDIDALIDAETLAVDITDTAIAFPGWVSKMSFDRRGQLIVHITVDANAELTNRDLIPLRQRMLRVEIQPAARHTASRPESQDPTRDPVAARIVTTRANRLIARWMEFTSGSVDDWFHPDDTDL